MTDVFLEAAEQAGHELTADFNGEKQAGFGYYTFIHKNGARRSAEAAYIDPIRHRPNLTILADRPTTRVLMEGKRAVGVAWDNGKESGRGSRARGDPQRRRVRLAAAADAVGDRRSGGAQAARDRGGARPAGGGREPPGASRHHARVQGEEHGALRHLVEGAAAEHPPRARLHLPAARGLCVQHGGGRGVRLDRAGGGAAGHPALLLLGGGEYAERQGVHRARLPAARHGPAGPRASGGSSSRRPIPR